MKKTLLIFMTLLTLGFTTRAAVGDEFTIDNIQYRILSEDKLTVRLTGYTSGTTFQNLDIPSTVAYNQSEYTVTTIDNYAFSNCSSLIEVNIPNSVKSIGDGAFMSCSSLTKVIIPDSVTKIGIEAFRNCWSLTDVTIPNSVTIIDEGAFYFCKSLPKLTISNSATTIGDYAFKCCYLLTEVIIPNSVTTIGENSFESCISLTEITIPYSVTEIGDGPFSNCRLLKNISIDGDNKNYCSENGILFNSDKTSLIQYPAGKEDKSYTIPNSTTKIGNSAFYGSKSLKEVNIPTSVITIGDYAFDYCISLTKITIPNSVTEISVGTFSDCSSLTELNIPNYVTSIGEFAFSGCSSLTKVIIPETVTEIGFRAFIYCNLISDIYSLASIPPTLGYNVFDHAADAVLHVPADAVDAYSQADQWRDFIIKAIDETGLDYIEADGCNGTAKYYKLNGVEADGEALSPGVYIKRQGDKATKVLIK